MENKETEQVIVTTSSGGVGFFGALFLVFLVLKLCNVINWSWWWITSPLWVPPVALIGLVVSVFVLIAIGFIIYVSVAAIINLFKKHV